MEKIKMIEIDHVFMKFNLASEKFDGFKEYIIRSLKKKITYNEFWALTDVTFDVYKGESLGLIGRNGSGKSTLLKIIAGVLKPTEGKVHVEGRVAPLIELGAGFDFDLTAKENVFLNGALLGNSRELMKAHYETRDIFANGCTYCRVFRIRRVYGCTSQKLFVRNGIEAGICNCDNWYSRCADRG